MIDATTNAMRCHFISVSSVLVLYFFPTCIDSLSSSEDVWPRGKKTTGTFLGRMLLVLVAMFTMAEHAGWSRACSVSAHRLASCWHALLLWYLSST